ncbi:glucose-1-phosphate cytidylyltransferase [Tardiphaga sp. vice352]|uniref:glucose-1-phosphate cytidylyltransferase n=1 Tax=Tardiphaga sp. vice352 TaxID=2592816 RepID=UPI001164D7FD|nr:glucose-1-phosphate cytidylyltransferase [Tardiphaga sp. vice352]QDM33323.1 glucose-1-phosphate cytidylyltransferase [Tardiphaga sp. vice352]
MKAVILAGGLGTRISEETTLRPKPMIEIGGRPVLWHIMKMYSAHGINDFIVCLGYKGYVIKEYFANYALHMSDVTFDMRQGTTIIHRNDADDWRVSLIDTGESTMTGGRLKRVMDHVRDEPFCMTYGDGVSDVDIGATLKFHQEHGGLATVTAVYPPKRFGQLEIVDTLVKDFKEKPDGEGGYINGGFFVLSPKVGSYIADDQTIWEREPLERLSHEGQLHAFRHDGFWQPMDTLRDKTYLEELWTGGKAPWKVWS